MYFQNRKREKLNEITTVVLLCRDQLKITTDRLVQSVATIGMYGFTFSIKIQGSPFEKSQNEKAIRQKWYIPYLFEMAKIHLRPLFSTRAFLSDYFQTECPFAQYMDFVHYFT